MKISLESPLRHESGLTRAARRARAALRPWLCGGVSLLSVFSSQESVAEAQEAPPRVVFRRILTGAQRSNLSTYNFVELFNPTSSPIDIGGWSIQYASGRGADALGAGSQITVLPSFVLQPGQAYLVQEMGRGSTTIAPVTPDLSGGTINMGLTSGKLALVRSASPLGCNGGSLPCSTEQLALIADLVGYNADFFQGTPINVRAAEAGLARYGHGCAITNDNRRDFRQDVFEILKPANSASRLDPCGRGTFEPCAKMTVPAKVWELVFGPNGGFPECPDCSDPLAPKLARILPACSGCLFSRDPGQLYLDPSLNDVAFRSRRIVIRAEIAALPALSSGLSLGLGQAKNVGTAAPVAAWGLLSAEAGVADSSFAAPSQICADVTGLFYGSLPGGGMALPTLDLPVSRVTLGVQTPSAYLFADVPDVTVDAPAPNSIE